MKKNLLIWLILLPFIFLSFRGCSPSQTSVEELKNGDIGLLTNKTSYNRGKEISLYVQNNTKENIAIGDTCPNPPFDVFFYKNGQWEKLTSTLNLSCPASPSPITLKPGEKTTFSYRLWAHSLFPELGRYQIRFIFNKQTFNSNEFSILKESFGQLLWQQLCYRPIYNTLIFFIDIFPGHSLGLAIILLTILIRLILLGPSQKAMRSQKKMQEIQPKLQEIQRKYKGQQDKIAAETMKIWKDHKVNPLGSCLPIAIQFPIMIALFYVVRDGINPDNFYLLYSPLKDFSLQEIHTMFLGILDLTKANKIVLPLTIGLLQFIQMKLSFTKRNKKNLPNNLQNDKKDVTQDQMEMMNKTFIYFMPIMITVFTASVPAGVGLYWGISTLFGVAQQLFVNRERDKNKPKVVVANAK